MRSLCYLNRINSNLLRFKLTPLWVDSDNCPVAWQTLDMELFACVLEARENVFHLVGKGSENFEDVAGLRACITDGSFKLFL